MFTWAPESGSVDEQFVVAHVSELGDYQRRGWKLLSIFQEARVASTTSYTFQPTAQGQHSVDSQYVDIYDGMGNKRSEYIRCPSGMSICPAVETHGVTVTLALLSNTADKVSAFTSLMEQKSTADIQLHQLKQELAGLQSAAKTKEADYQKSLELTKRNHESAMYLLSSKVKTVLGIQPDGIDKAVEKMWTAVTNLKPEGSVFEAFKVTMSSSDWGTAFQIASAVAVRPGT